MMPAGVMDCSLDVAMLAPLAVPSLSFVTKVMRKGRVLAGMTSYLAGFGAKSKNEQIVKSGNYVFSLKSTNSLPHKEYAG